MLERCSEDLEFFDKRIDKGLIARLQKQEEGVLSLPGMTHSMLIARYRAQLGLGTSG